MIVFLVVCALVVVFQPAHISCQTLVGHTQRLITNVFTSYNKVIPPRVIGGGAVKVKLEMFPMSIQEFDEASEKFVYPAGLRMIWYDYRLRWTPSEFAGIEEVTIPVTEVWTPGIILASAATKEMSVLQPWNHVRVSHNGEVYVMQAMLVQSSCSVNVRYFPFDYQSCDTLFMSLLYKSDEVEIQKKDTGLSLNLYTENAIWDIVSTDVFSELIRYANEYQIHFKFHLKRKSQYVTINLLVPILCLSLLNTLVFLLVPESGERVGYCITTLLAIAVYMTIIMDTLPQSSTPVPLISYKLVGDLVCSAFIIVCVIINLRIHGQADDKPVPTWLKAVHRFLTCKICKRKSDATNNTPPTWKDIGHLIDVLCFCVFFSVAILSFTIFVGNAKSQTSSLDI